MDVARVILLTGAAYVGLGLAFAVAFVSRGIVRLDPTAAGAPLQFRLIILPGVVALWPWLLRRWIRSGGNSSPSQDAGVHERGAGT